MPLTFIEFLKKYSTINNKFIDDFYGLYNIDDPNAFNVNLDILSLWFGCRKDSLKQTLIRSYTKNTNYKIIKKSKSNPNETIMLTSDTLKLLCMRTKSKKGEYVRNYYLQLEKLVDKYKNHIINSMSRKIKQLENNQRPKVNPKKGVIYIIKTSDEIGLYKIGRTTNLKKRLNGYNADKADDIVPIFIYETDDVETVEQCTKSLLKKYAYRKYKEIYQADVDFIKEAINLCDTSNSKLTLIQRNTSRRKSNDNHNYFIGIYNQDK